EGFTVYFERRIMENIYGSSYAEMLAALGYQDLVETVEDLEASGKGEDTRLKLNLTGRDPDEGVSDIAYEKGYFFLRSLEKIVGRENFDKFLNKYFSENAFKSIDTEKFIAYINQNLLQKDKINVDPEFISRWIYTMGLPHDLEAVTSQRFQNVNSEIQKFRQEMDASELNTKDWSSHEWLYFVRNLQADLTLEHMEALDKNFNLTNSGNAEILTAWFLHVIGQGYTPGYPQLEKFLTTVGRRKFLVPLYKELAKTPEGLSIAMDTYKKARPNYHYVSINTLDELLDYKP
ncbi:MAG: leukotriene A4 hydrolase C-terminal domain-containing protein, partial [Bacteroidota bacterium]|nr:leukotriene A4 hydrolase C-terminal domain-containing protein [Bacteroidota bacterium]